MQFIQLAGAAKEPVFALRRRGLSLTELLTVIAVIVVLAAILLPVLAASVRRAYTADEMSAMRQIGLAQGLYEIDHEGTYSIGDLVSNSYLSPTLVKSSRDEVTTGAASKIFVHDHKAPPSFSQTYYDLGSFFEARSGALIEDLEQSGHEGIGWVFNPIDLAPPDTGATPYFTRLGRYHRLLLNGAVVLKSAQGPYPCAYEGSDGQMHQGMQESRLAFFSDFQNRDQMAISTDCGAEFGTNP